MTDVQRGNNGLTPCETIAAKTRPSLILLHAKKRVCLPMSRAWKASDAKLLRPGLVKQTLNFFAMQHHTDCQDISAKQVGNAFLFCPGKNRYFA